MMRMTDDEHLLIHLWWLLADNVRFPSVQLLLPLELQ